MQDNLTDNHLQLLLFVFRAEVCCFQHMIEGTGKSETHCKEKIKQLLNWRYVKRTRHLAHMPYFYYLTKKGFVACGLEKPQLRRYDCKHTLRAFICTDLALQYEKCGYSIIYRQEIIRNDPDLGTIAPRNKIRAVADFVVNFENLSESFSVDVIWQDLTYHQQKVLLRDRSLFNRASEHYFYVSKKTARSMWGLVTNERARIFEIDQFDMDFYKMQKRKCLTTYKECEAGYASLLSQDRNTEGVFEKFLFPEEFL